MNVKAMPPLFVVPQPKLRRLIDAGGLADSTMCWTCSSCDSECPVEIATNRLRPQRIVRFASLGLIDELIALPEIWYCLTCRRCNRVCLECGRCTDACTQKVDGCLMIARLRELAIRDGKVSVDFALRLRQAQQPIFMRLVDEIDCLLGVQAAAGSRTREPACPPAVERV